MNKLLLHSTVFLLYSQYFQIFLRVIAIDPDLNQLMGNTESARWPLQAGYPGLAISNLNEYVSLFSHCLVNVQNYQGIEIIGIQSPVYTTRFDVANLEYCYGPSESYRSKNLHRFYFGQIPPKSEQHCLINYELFIQYKDISMKSRFYCRAYFDLFFPEPADAPHIVEYSWNKMRWWNFDILTSSHLFNTGGLHKKLREGWSKLLISANNLNCQELNCLTSYYLFQVS